MYLHGSNVLVTGGAGFIGSHLVERLLDYDCTVVVADNFSRGKVENVSRFSDEIDLLPVDLTTESGCLRATEGADYVFHLAASVGGIHYIKRENVGGLTPSVLMNQHMLEAARRNQVDRFLFASSACLYRQETDELNRFSEDQALPANPHSTYGWAKVLGEIACQAYHTDCALDTGMVRIFNAYGPREILDPDSAHVVPSLCRKVVEAEPGGAIELFGDGTQERGFLYATDLVEGMIRAMERATDGHPINLGNGDEVVTIEDLAREIIDISGKDLSITHDRSKPTGTDKYAADTSEMERTLDWTPEVPLSQGLERTYRWVEEELTGDRTPRTRADGGVGR